MRSIHVLRKPCSESTVTANVLRHGTGGINVNGSRIAWANEADAAAVSAVTTSFIKTTTTGQGASLQMPFAPHRRTDRPPAQGRWPANLVLGACLDSELDEVFPHTKSAAVYNHPPQTGRNKRTFRIVRKEVLTTQGAGDEGSAARYFKRVNG